jgi:hypothetical protein
MADIRSPEAGKARILMIRSAATDTPLDQANTEWVEVRVERACDLANWRVQHLRALWRTEVGKPVESEWVYTFGSPHFAKAGEIYRIHSGSMVRAAMHPVADDLTQGRKHVYVAGPLGAARLIWTKGDYVRLVDAFGTVMDEVVVWPEAAQGKAEREGEAARS